MNRLIAIACLCGLALGCATVRGGPTQNVAVTSEPDGAMVTARCGRSTAATVTTPGTISVSRRAVPCEIVVEKEGYDAATVVLAREVSPRFWSNMKYPPLAGVVAGALAGGDCSGGGFGPCFSAEETGTVGAILGLVVGGIGLAIDGATGAMFQRNPPEIHVTLSSRHARDPVHAPEPRPHAAGALP